MATVWATIHVELEVEDEALEEYGGDAFQWAIDDLSVDTVDGKYLEYRVEEVDTDYQKKFKKFQKSPCNREGFLILCNHSQDGHSGAGQVHEETTY